MPRGKITRYDAKSGRGYVAPDDGGKEVFFHRHYFEIQGDNISIGARVQFRVARGYNSPKAKNLKVIDDDAS